jgi:hypothetical protein
MSIDPHLLGWLLLSMPRKHWPQNRSELEAEERWQRSGWPIERLRKKIYYSYVANFNIDTLQEHLRLLEKIGLIQPSDEDKDDPNSSYPWSKWRLSNVEETRNLYQDYGHENGRGGHNDGGNGGNNGGGQGGGGQDGDSGRGGIREVLGHPTLFSLPRSEFENWVNNLF